MPVLAMGGEASFAPAEQLKAAFSPVAADLTTYVIPKAGHWIGDENPTASAQRVLQFLAADNASVPSVDLSWLDDTTTMFGAFGTEMTTAGINGLRSR